MTLTQLPERILSKIDTQAVGGCWLWTAYVNPDGYGVIRWEGESIGAHRVIYELLVGPYSTETLDHLCRVRHCVNPGHLEPVSRRENILRSDCIGARKARRTHCDRGHPFAGDNVYYYPSGARECVTCRKEGRRRRRALTDGTGPYANN